MVESKQYLGARTSYVTFGNRVKAFLAMPERGDAPYPAAILCHERYGLVQHTLDLAAKFASYGFVGIAPDMFSRWDGDRDALNRGDIIVRLSDDDIISYMGETLDYLRDRADVKHDSIAAIGICQSGEYPLLLNSVRKEIAANVVIYGGAQGFVWELRKGPCEDYHSMLKEIQAPVLGIWGEDDFVVSVDDVLRLRSSLERHRKSYEFILFPHMPHGWLNSTMPGRFRAKEADEAWHLIIDFLERAFSGAFPRDRAIWRFYSNMACDYDFSQKERVA
jgi:carboxymethylenebutenolidase